MIGIIIDEVKVPHGIPSPAPRPPNAVAGGVPGGVPGGAPGEPRIIRKTTEELTRSAIKRVDAGFPPLARAARVSGNVVVEVVVDEEGNVIRTRTVSGHPLLKDPALIAARQWKFEPATFAGEPVRVIGTLKFVFNLPR